MSLKCITTAAAIMLASAGLWTTFSASAGAAGIPGQLANYIGGLTLSNDGTAPNSVLDIAAGTAPDSTNAVVISSGDFKKSTAGAWASGSGSNGMGNGLTIAANTWYHICLANNGAGGVPIGDGGTPDYWFDTSVTGANRPSGISDTKYRRIGSFETDGSSNILAFTQRGDTFVWNTQKLDANNQTYNSTPTLVRLSVPPGVPKEAYMVAYNGNGTSSAILIYDPDATGTNVSGAGYGQCQTTSVTSFTIVGSCVVIAMTNTSGQVDVAAVASTAGIYINTYQYRDFRGQ
jgi:hypothetical protein